MPEVDATGVSLLDPDGRMPDCLYAVVPAIDPCKLRIAFVRHWKHNDHVLVYARIVRRDGTDDWQARYVTFTPDRDWNECLDRFEGNVRNLLTCWRARRETMA
ncbi:MAG: hypothetical protein WD066_07235 [Planctomycetaceae bacterium]